MTFIWEEVWGLSLSSTLVVVFFWFLCRDFLSSDVDLDIGPSLYWLSYSSNGSCSLVFCSVFDSSLVDSAAPSDSSALSVKSELVAPAWQHKDDHILDWSLLVWESPVIIHNVYTDLWVHLIPMCIVGISLVKSVTCWFACRRLIFVNFQLLYCLSMSQNSVCMRTSCFSSQLRDAHAVALEIS